MNDLYDNDKVLKLIIKNAEDKVIIINSNLTSDFDLIELLQSLKNNNISCKYFYFEKKDSKIDLIELEWY